MFSTTFPALENFVVALIRLTFLIRSCVEVAAEDSAEATELWKRWRRQPKATFSARATREELQPTTRLIEQVRPVGPPRFPKWGGKDC